MPRPMSRPVTDLFPVSSVFRPDRRMNYGPGMPTPPIASTRPVTTSSARRRARPTRTPGSPTPSEPEVAAYLAAERAYYDARVAPLAGLRGRAGGRDGRPGARRRALGAVGERRLALPPGDGRRPGVRAPRAPPRRRRRRRAGGRAARPAGGARRRRHGLRARRRASRSAPTAAGSPGRSTSTATRSTRCASATSRPASTSTRSCRAPTTRGAWSADSTLVPLHRARRGLPAVPGAGCHVLGTPVDDDVLVLEDLDERLELELRPSRSGALGRDRAAGPRVHREWLRADLRRDRGAAAGARRASSASSTTSSTRPASARTAATASSS